MRKSGIELLRILAACSVVILHYYESSNDVGGEGVNILIQSLLVSFAICAVNVFVAISGYFMINSQKRTFGKALSLLFQVTLIHLSLYLFSVISGNTSFEWGLFIENLVPHNYFVILYVVMYFITPYVNTLITGLSQISRKRLLVISIILFSIWPTVVNVSGELLGIKWFGLSSIGAWGSQQGFTIVNFILLYSIGACLHLGTFEIKRRLLPIVLCGFVIFGWVSLETFMGATGARSAWDYHNPFVILLTILLVNYFKGITWKSSIVNSIAKASFMCYLLHQIILSHSNIEYFVRQSPLIMIAHIGIVIIIAYSISWICYNIYNRTCGLIFNKLDNFQIKY